MRRCELSRLAKNSDITDEQLDQLDTDILQQLEGRLIAHTVDELVDAYRVGKSRHFEAIAQGKHDNHGFRGERGLEFHCIGAAGEYAAAKALGIPWERTINTFKLADLGTIIQVRTRPYKKGWEQDLQVRPGDKDDEIFVHVVEQLSPLQFRVYGWLYGRDAKKTIAWTRPDRPNPVYYTPWVDLDTLQTLQEILAGIQTNDTH
jgi:hypothetical protein